MHSSQSIFQKEPDQLLRWHQGIKIYSKPFKQLKWMSQWIGLNSTVKKSHWILVCKDEKIRSLASPMNWYPFNNARKPGETYKYNNCFKTTVSLKCLWNNSTSEMTELKFMLFNSTKTSINDHIPNLDKHLNHNTSSIIWQFYYQLMQTSLLATHSSFHLILLIFYTS